MYLEKDEIKEKIEEENLVKGYVHLDTQLREQSFDLTVSQISEVKGSGEIDFSNDERKIPEINPLQPRKKESEDEYGWWMLPKGSYIAETNEEMNLPEGTIAVLQPRLSVVKSGVNVPTRILTSGELTEIEFPLIVNTDNGFEVKENARLITAIFINFKKKSAPGFLE